MGDMIRRYAVEGSMNEQAALSLLLAIAGGLFLIGFCLGVGLMPIALLPWWALAVLVTGFIWLDGTHTYAWGWAFLALLLLPHAVVLWTLVSSGSAYVADPVAARAARAEYMALWDRLGRIGMAGAVAYVIFLMFLMIRSAAEWSGHGDVSTGVPWLTMVAFVAWFFWLVGGPFGPPMGGAGVPSTVQQQGPER